MARIVNGKGTVDIRIPFGEQDKNDPFYDTDGFVNHFFKDIANGGDGNGAGDGNGDGNEGNGNGGGGNGGNNGGDGGNGNGGAGGGNGGGGNGGGNPECQCEDCCPELTEQVLEAVSERVDEHVDEHVTDALAKSMAETTANMQQEFMDSLKMAEAGVAKNLAEMEERIKKFKRIEISFNNGDWKPVPGHTHKQFEDLLKLVATKNPVLMVGPAGSGKTFAALQVANALELNFYANSVCAQTSESKLLGYMNANGGYVTTEFRKAFEQGGVYLMDEIDAGNPNVIVVMNAALSSEFCAFPDGMVKKHDNFLFLAAANTFGTGADRQYVGRNQLDLATLDRFIMLEWVYDLLLEETLVSHHAWHTEWLMVIYRMRELIQQNAYRLIVSPRATMQGASLLSQGFSIEDVLAMRVMPTASHDQRKYLLENSRKQVGDLNVSISRAA